jgi:heptose I phosphotransferase
MKLWLHQELKPVFQEKKEKVFDTLMTIQGQTFRKREGRCTQQITLNERNYFIKRFSDISWSGLFKSICTLKLYSLSIKNEFSSLQKLHQFHILAPRIYAYGYTSSLNPNKIQSFIITESLLNHTISLTDFCNTWKQSPPSFALKNAILKKIAQIAKNLHKNGIIHQDLYFHHLLLDVSSINSSLQNIKIYLIDFHRSFIQKKPRQRWFIKDLAGLYCSGKFINFTNRDIFRFLKEYRGQSLRAILQNEKSFLAKIKNRGERTYNMELNKKLKSIR